MKNTFRFDKDADKWVGKGLEPKPLTFEVSTFQIKNMVHLNEFNGYQKIYDERILNLWKLTCLCLSGLIQF